MKLKIELEGNELQVLSLDGPIVLYCHREGCACEGMIVVSLEEYHACFGTCWERFRFQVCQILQIYDHRRVVAAQKKRAAGKRWALEDRNEKIRSFAEEKQESSIRREGRMSVRELANAVAADWGTLFPEEQDCKLSSRQLRKILKGL